MIKIDSEKDKIMTGSASFQVKPLGSQSKRKEDNREETYSTMSKTKIKEVATQKESSQD